MNKMNLNKTLFKTQEQKAKIEMENFFSDVDIPKLSENQVKLCEKNLTEKVCKATNL